MWWRCFFLCFQEYPRTKVKSKIKVPDVNNIDSIIKSKAYIRIMGFKFSLFILHFYEDRILSHPYFPFFLPVLPNTLLPTPPMALHSQIDNFSFFDYYCYTHTHTCVYTHTLKHTYVSINMFITQYIKTIYWSILLFVWFQKWWLIVR